MTQNKHNVAYPFIRKEYVGEKKKMMKVINTLCDYFILNILLNIYFYMLLFWVVMMIALSKASESLVVDSWINLMLISVIGFMIAYKLWEESTNE